jgi:type I restriction enzyme S subunit
MNAERLLAHYARIADAPDAIASLRRFILDLAVRGKLVPQAPKDEPAAELRKRIAKETARLLKAGKFSEPSNPVQIKRDDLPFVSPNHWEWARLIEIAQPSYGFAFPSSQFNSGKRGTPLIRIRDISATDTQAYFEGTYDPTYLVKAGDYLVGMDGDFNLRRWRGTDALLNQRVLRLNKWRCGVDPEFIKLPLQFILDHLHSETSLTTVKHLSAKQVNGIEIPIPPLAEQHRIVAKVDELMALCDRLEAARAGREAARDRVATASLARLNAPDPKTFQDDARFALDALAALTTRPDQIKTLRQTILNLAVRGKLVPQNPNDEPASELLKRIAAEKTRLVKEGKAKRQDPLPEPDLDQAPFELPAGWAWGRFPELGTFGRGKSKHRPRNDPALFDGGTHLMIQTGDVARSQGVIETYTSKYNDFGLSQSFKWSKGTLCITIAANIADSGILSFGACFPDSVVGFIPASMFENARYFEYFVRTAKANLLEFAPATAQKNINLEILTQVLIPLPPLAEQHRIVAKVDDLMALCDRLEASLTTGDETRRRLLDALLHEALAPIEERDEAA